MMRGADEGGEVFLGARHDADGQGLARLLAAYIGMALRTAFTGNDDATLTEAGTEYPVRIRLDRFDRRNFADVQQLTVVNPMGMPLQVAQFAHIQRGNAPSLLERKDRALRHVRLDRVSPLAVPVLVMIGRESVPQGAADDELLFEAETLAGAAMRADRG